MMRPAAGLRRLGKGLLVAGVAALGITFDAAADSPVPVPAGAAGIDWSGAQLVTVQLVDDRFVPEKLSFRHGVPYRLRLENSGATMHEFTAPEFFKAVEMKNPEVLEQGGHEVLLQPKEKKDLYFVAQKPAHYDLSCADHDWDGMTGDITVQ